MCVVIGAMQKGIVIFYCACLLPGYTWEHLNLPGPPDVQTDGHQKTAPAFNEYFSTVWNLNIPGSCRWEKVNKNAFALLPLCCIVFGIT